MKRIHSVASLHTHSFIHSYHLHNNANKLSTKHFCNYLEATTCCDESSLSIFLSLSHLSYTIRTISKRWNVLIEFYEVSLEMETFFLGSLDCSALHRGKWQQFYMPHDTRAALLLPPLSPFSLPLLIRFITQTFPPFVLWSQAEQVVFFIYSIFHR